MRQYLDLLGYVLDCGERREDRTGTGTISVFDVNLKFDLNKGFPAITSKKLYWKGVVYELLWMIRGDSNIKYLIDNNVHIWDADAFRWHKQKSPDYPYDKEQFLQDVAKRKIYYAFENGEKYIAGDLGPVYGSQWRNYHKYYQEGESKGDHYTVYKTYTADPLYDLIENIKHNPYSRRHILNSWNVGELDQMALPPCHMLSQFYVSNDKKLSCKMTQRSADLFLGIPFNIASYALLTHMIAQVCELGVGNLTVSIGDAHIYLNHIKQVEEQLVREPLSLCRLALNPVIRTIDDFTFDDIELVDYKFHPPIKGKLSVGI